MDIEKIFTMTNTQQGILYQSLLEEGIYDELICFKLNDVLDTEKVQASWNIVAKNNMILRTIARWGETKKPVLVVLKEKEIDVKAYSSTKSINNILEEEQKIGIDIQKHSVRIVMCSELLGDQYMILISHHLFIDGWSTNLLLSYFWKAYNNQDIHHTKDYQDYLIYLKNIDKKNKGGSCERTECKLEKMFLPYQTEKKKDIRVSTIELEKHICAKVSDIHKEANVSIATIFYVAWTLFVGCYNENPYFGITCSGRYRENRNFNDVVGLFINTTPFAVELLGEETLKQLYARINNRVIDLESQQNGSIVDMSNNSLNSFQEFNSICVVENYPMDINPAFEIFRVIERTHYDCVAQFYISEGMQIKLISNGSINTEGISKKFVEVFSRVINWSLDTQIKDVLMPYKYNVCVLSFFETLPFVNQGKNINRILNLNVNFDTVDLRNIGLMQKSSYDYIYIFLGLEYLVERNDNTNVLNLLFEQIEELALHKRNISIVKMEGVYPDRVINKEFLHTYYDNMDGLFNKYNNVEIIDASENIKNNIEKHYNKVLYYDANVPFDQSIYDVLADIVYRNIYYKNNSVYKVIVLDCDNTLWKGIVADVGVENIAITKEYLKFQTFLKRKQQEGFLLALCSKNYNETVYEVFNSVDMPLKWEDFVATRINWNRKSDNLLELSEELGLATNSFIFIDDSMDECMEVVDKLSEVCTIPFPTDNENVVTFFESLWIFDKFKVIEEDANRTQLYINQKKRKSVLTDNISENLQKLKMRIYLNRLNECNSERISQLSYRTNQFNLNGKKIETKECESWCVKNNNYVISAKDEFGEYGIIGFVKFEVEEEVLYITHYLISCRILGRYVEFAILRFLCDQNESIRHLVFDVYDTGRNQYFLNFLEKIVTKKDSRNGQAVIDVNVFYENNLKFLDDIICSKEEFVSQKNKTVEVSKAHTLRASSGADKSLEVCLPEEYLKRIDAVEWGKFIRVIYDKKTNTVDDNLRNKEKMHDSDFTIRPELFQKTLEIWNRVLNISSHKYYENFYDAGGTSLIAMELVAKISRDLDVSIGIADILKNPNLKDLVYLITCRKNGEDSRIVHVIKNKFLISSLAESIFIMHELSDNTVLNLPYLFEIEGAFDLEKFEGNLNKIICNNRIFRTRYAKEENKVYAYVLDDIHLNVEKVVIDTHIDDQFLKQHIKRFDLANAPLIRCFYFVATVEDRQYLLLDFHHIIMDGQSLRILINAINELYANSLFEFNKEDYFDYTEWYRESRLNDKDSTQLDYWKNELSDSNCKLNILENVTNNKKFIGQVYDYDLPKAMGKKIRESSKQNQVSDFVYLLTLFEIFLYKYTGDRSNNIGVPISCRDNTQMMRMMGMLVNTVTLKSEIIENESFEKNMQAVKKKVLLAMENKLVALQRVQEFLEVDSLFDTMFVYNNVNFNDVRIGDNKLINIPFHNQVSQKLIVLEIIDDSEMFHCNFTYNDEVFSQDSIVALSTYFIELANMILLNERETVSKLQVVNSSEMTKIDEWSVGANSVYEDVKLIDIFHRSVNDNLENTAFIYGKRKYSYEKVNSMVNNLACDMLKCGVKERDSVIFIPDNPLCAAIGILAVMKCGAVYIPILKTTPTGRIEGIVEKSNAKHVFSNDIIIGDSNHKYYLNESDNKNNVYNGCGGNDLAYIIFTSGTTGTSKGVMVQNSAIINSILWRIKEFNFYVKDVSILLLGLAFDGFMTSFFTPLLSGTLLVLIDDIRDGKKIVKMLFEHHVTNFITTPTLYNIILDFIEKDSLRDLKMVVLAGESVSAKLLQKSELTLPDIELINEYGPTENSVVSTCKRGMSSKDISVGKPINNCRIRIEDVDGNLCPIGIKGEVCLSGNSLAKGYLGDEQGTKSVFIRKSNELWYHTGDIGRWNNKGELCIYGRMDVQCKINGYRVDLTEIEKYVMQMESISFCSVVNSAVFRCYYFSDDFISHKDFVKSLGVHLPYYLIPNEFIRISSIPVSQNGKRDESSLEQYAIAPKENVEVDPYLKSMIEECYKDVLHIENMSCDDNFFSLGGNSMYAIELQEALKKKLYMDIPVIDIFTFPTVNMMVENISSLSLDNSLSKERNRYKQEVICNGLNKYQYVRLQYTINRLKLVELSNLMNIEEEKIMVSMLMLLFAELTEDKKINCFVHLNGNGRLIEYDYQDDKEIKEYLQDMADIYLQVNGNEDINLYIDYTIVISDKYINIRERKIEEFYIYMSKEGEGYRLLFDVNSSKIRTEKINQTIGRLASILNLDIKEWE